jgi:phospholipid transport system substrate-binding protein
MKAARRATLISISLALCLLVQPGVGAAAGASDTVRNLYQALLYNMQYGASLGQQGRVARLAPVVPRAFNIPYMTQLAIGPAWATLPEAQRQQLIQAFERYVAAVYAERFDRYYAGERLEVLGEQPTTYGTIVRTQIVDASGKPINLNYLMVAGAGGSQIGDVYLNGTVSELASRRSEFSSILRTQGVNGLIASLNSKALTLAPPRR